MRDGISISWADNSNQNFREQFQRAPTNLYENEFRAVRNLAGGIDNAGKAVGELGNLVYRTARMKEHQDQISMSQDMTNLIAIQDDIFRRSKGDPISKEKVAMQAFDDKVKSLVNPNITLEGRNAWNLEVKRLRGIFSTHIAKEVAHQQWDDSEKMFKTNLERQEDLVAQGLALEQTINYMYNSSVANGMISKDQAAIGLEKSKQSIAVKRINFDIQKAPGEMLEKLRVRGKDADRNEAGFEYYKELTPEQRMQLTYNAETAMNKLRSATVREYDARQNAGEVIGKEELDNDVQRKILSQKQADRIFKAQFQSDYSIYLPVANKLRVDIMNWNPLTEPLKENEFALRIGGLPKDSELRPNLRKFLDEKRKAEGILNSPEIREAARELHHRYEQGVLGKFKTIPVWSVDEKGNVQLDTKGNKKQRINPITGDYEFDIDKVEQQKAYQKYSDAVSILTTWAKQEFEKNKVYPSQSEVSKKINEITRRDANSTVEK